MNVRASLTDVKSHIRSLEFHKENIRKLGDQAQRSADLVKSSSFWLSRLDLWEFAY